MQPISLPCVIAVGYAKAHRKLSKVPPPVSLLTLPPILALIGQVTIIVAAQAFVYVYIQQAPW